MLRHWFAVSIAAACLLSWSSLGIAEELKPGNDKTADAQKSNADTKNASSDASTDSDVKKSAAKPGKHDWLLKHATIQTLLKLHNEERARNGRPKLALNPRMCLEAQKHAVWMAETGIYQHSGLPWQEIIFQGPQSEQAAVQGWIHSPAHHGIMLSGSECGFGYMVINGRTYWVGVFR
jgi:uncharacterized protein YkwD